MKNISLIVLAIALLSAGTVQQNLEYILDGNTDPELAFDVVEGVQSPHLHTEILWFDQTLSPSVLAEQEFTRPLPLSLFTASESIYKASCTFIFIQQSLGWSLKVASLHQLLVELTRSLYQLNRSQKMQQEQTLLLP